MSNFSRVIVGDFEYETSRDDRSLVPGDLPEVLCGVFHELEGNPLQVVRTHKLWRGEFGPTPPFDVGSDTLFVAYSAWAEMTCFLVLGWEFPAHIFDQHSAYLATSNILLPHSPDEERRKPKKDLATACRAYDVEGWEGIDKQLISKDIGDGRWRLHGRERCLEYCEADVLAQTELFKRQLRGHGRKAPANVPLNLHWANFTAKSVAMIQAKGMPIDVPLWKKTQEHKQPIIANLLRRFDPSFGTEMPIYDSTGAWSYDRFEAFLSTAGVIAWPRLETGRLDISGDAFRLMYHVPGIKNLHMLRDSLNVIVKAKLPIGRDGRNRPSLFPLGTATGRNAHARSLFNAHAAMRAFMLFPDDVIAVYLDWAQQEILIGAALSGDLRLIDAYMSGDVYHAFAYDIGLTSETDIKRWKKTDPETRDRMKSLYLAIIYGMGVPSLAKSLDRHPVIASALIERHKRRYPRFWEWREWRVRKAMEERVTVSEGGWPLRLSTSPNQRTLYNFPNQANGAECLRLAATRLCEAGIVPSMLVHDAVLLEARDSEQVRHAKEIMLAAGHEVCGITIRVDGDDEPIKRYRDKRGVKMWARMMETLQGVGAIPKGRQALLDVGVAPEEIS